MKTSRICYRCHNEYELTSEFWYKNRTKPHGFDNRCKACAKSEAHARYISDPNREKDRVKQWHEQNPEKARNADQQWRKQNPDYHRNWRKNNPEYYKNWKDSNPEYQETWYRDNIEKKRATNRRRRASKVKAGGNHTELEILELNINQGGLCFHCGCNLASTGYHADHWIPISKGGSNDIGNIRLLCPSCNWSKGAKLPCEWDSRYCD